MKIYRKLTAILLVLMLILSLAACGSKEEEEPQDTSEPASPDIILITDTAGLGGGGLNDSCWAGLEMAKEEYGLEIYCMETGAEESYISKIEEACNMQPQLIICAGADMASGLKTVAAEKPDMKFAIINAEGLGDNVMGITFSEQDAAFLAGIAAGMTTQSKIVSFIGAKESAEQLKYQYAFAAGVATVATDIYVNTQYLGSYTDTEAAKTITNAHIALGSDVIFQATGKCGQTVVEACASKGVWCIGCGVDQSEYAPEWVLCSVVRRADNVLFDAITKFHDGAFDGTDIKYTLAGAGVELSDNAGNLTDEVKAAVEQYSQLLSDGQIAAPTDWQTYADYLATLQ